MARTLIYGNAPWCPSGYGTQAAQLGRTLRKNGHEVAFAPFHGLQGCPINWGDFQVYPGSGEDPWAMDLLPHHYRHFQADLLITLMDAWVLPGDQLAASEMRYAHWQPVDCEPLGVLDRKVLDTGGGRPIALSRFGQRQFIEAGYADALYAPHALDMEVWRPLAEREDTRKQYGFGDRFLIGMNAANQDPFRKGFSEQFHAFKIFAERHDDALMLVHTRAQTRQGANLQQMITTLGLDGRVILGDQYLISGGWVSEGQMVTWHSILDVLSNCSWGEGFGLPILQSLATGTPVVVTDCSSMMELCGAGWRVAGQRLYNRGHEAHWTIPSIDAVVDAYEQAYVNAGDLREKAVEFAQAYDADLVFKEHWAGILDELIPA